MKTNPQAECSIPGHVGHTNATCRWQLLQKQPKKKTKGSAAATASAAASDND
jgi:hypothetical protein